MDNRKSLYFILPLIALVLMACRVGSVRINSRHIEGSGNVVTEEREVSGVERVSLEFVGDLTVIQGDEEGLTIEADDNLMEVIETRMQGHELIIGLDENVDVDTDNPIRYTLRVRDLDRITVSGSGNVVSQKLDVETLDLRISGSGNMTIEELVTTDLEVRISGSGNVDLLGTADEQDIHITGSGNYHAGDLHSRQVNVVVSGSGDVSVWPDESLDVRITGFGNVSYYGSPKVTQSITGSGSISSLGTHK